MYININRVEFVITEQCTGHCKHCSVGDKLYRKGHIEYEKLRGMLTKLSDQYTITSVMCFGGEPLLYYNEVKGILGEAADCGVSKRQLITNGFFTNKQEKLLAAVAALEEARVNDILLSVDTFHQETIPIEMVHEFARRIKEVNRIPIRLQPAWVVNREHDNPYNNRTKQLLNQFEDLELIVSSGNNIFPAGKALEYLSEYFPEPRLDLAYRCGDAPYSTRLDQVDSISIEANGDVTVCCFSIGNIFMEDILTILNRYNPYDIPMMKVLLEEGVSGLVAYAMEQGMELDINKFHTPCGVCRYIVDNLH
jgi:MoaA/NifB/PqqE/SkfB family radical SAM enzyme